MPLVERERLLRDYRAAVQAYHEAVVNLEERRFDESWKLTESARERVESARAALLGGESASNPAAPGSVALFNVNTERWVLFENTECGQAPVGALAYAALPDHRRGDWITNATEMSNRERQNAKLYYTEAGLALLREAGLEM